MAAVAVKVTYRDRIQSALTPMTWKRIAVAAAALAVAYVGLSLLAGVTTRALYREEYSSFKSIKRGMTEEQVVARLGKPQRVYERATAPREYYVEGYTFKRRNITSRVLIYIGSKPIAYVYLDRKNQVEEVFIGWS